MKLGVNPNTKGIEKWFSIEDNSWDLLPNNYSTRDLEFFIHFQPFS